MLKEITRKAGRIKAVIPGSAAEQIGVQSGDELLAINGEPCEDVIDVQYHGAEEWPQRWQVIHRSAGGNPAAY